VRIPSGEYTVEARIDTGPLAGLIKGSTEVSFRGTKPRSDLSQIAYWLGADRRRLILGAVCLLALATILVRMRSNKKEAMSQ
jgi:hypothetical protein